MKTREIHRHAAWLPGLAAVLVMAGCASTQSVPPSDTQAGQSSPSGQSAFTGEIPIPPNEEGDLVLAALAADVYTVVAGFHGPGGEIQIRDPFVAVLAVATT